MRMTVDVQTYGLPEKFQLFTDVQARQAIRSAVSAGGRRGRSLAKAGAPVRTGAGKAAIRMSSVRGLRNSAVAKVFIAGGRRGPAYYMYFQDQGTGDRHTRSGADRGAVQPPQFFMERAALRLDNELPAILAAEVDKALAKSGLA